MAGSAVSSVLFRLENGFLNTWVAPPFEGVFGLVKFGVTDRVILELADYLDELRFRIGLSSTDF